MPYIKIIFVASPRVIWVKVNDKVANDPDCWDYALDHISSNVEAEPYYQGPYDLAPALAQVWDLTK